MNYLNVSCGYGYQWNFVKKCGYNNAYYLSTESNNGRLEPQLNDTFEPINKYIILLDVIDAKPQDSYKIKRYYATTNIIQFYLTVLIISILVLIFCLSYKKNEKQDKINLYRWS